MKNITSNEAASSLPSFGEPVPQKREVGGGSVRGEALLVIDNYDSFTYNLVHAIKKISGLPIDVFRNDQITLEEIEKYDKIVLSPGPGLPEEAGLLLDIIKKFAASKSILGVCLGQQAIAEAFGGTLRNLNRVFHGIATSIELTGNHSVLFEDLPKTFEVGRYHSWIVENETLPACFEVTSYDDNGTIMSLRHKEFDLEGVQFHPESVLTPLGEKMIANWLKAPSNSPKGEDLNNPRLQPGEK